MKNVEIHAVPQTELPRAAEPSARIAELLRLATDTDVAVVDLSNYASHQRAYGADEVLQSGGAFRAIENGPVPTEGQLSDLADPIEAQALGFQSYAAVPVRDDIGRIFGRVAVLVRADREFAAADLKLLRTAADLVADLLDRNC